MLQSLGASVRDLGDFQTPPALVAAVLDQLGPIGPRWPRVLEPTCGRGHFVSAMLGRESAPKQVIGIEIQDDHARAAREAAGDRGRILRASLFDLDLRRDLTWDVDGPLLVVGNPPWITSAALGALGSANLPRKRNVKGSAGLNARTGAANFDIAEAVWFKLVEELADQCTTIALLCKMSVARGVLEHARRRGWPIADAAIHRIDAAKWFGAAVEGCLLQMRLGTVGHPAPVPVYEALGAAQPRASLAFTDRGPVADSERYRTAAFADGCCPVTWRQGVKHDAADVMELTRAAESGPWRNGLGETVDVEPDYVYPLLKGREVAGTPGVERAVIVTQRALDDDTSRLADEAPRLWSYLVGHAERLARRKSSIYRGRPPFAMFGIGPYTFAPCKVAVSGLHKTPRFAVYGPRDGRPCLCDDTCYFLPFAKPKAAALAAALLDEPAARGLIGALLFTDAKRPVTKRLLQRIDLSALLTRTDRPALLARADEYLKPLGQCVGDWPERLDDLLVEFHATRRPESPRSAHGVCSH